MPPRRGRGRKAATPTKGDNPLSGSQNDGSQSDAEMSESQIASNGGAEAGEPMDQDSEVKEEFPKENGDNADAQPPADDVNYPFQVKVSHLPPSYHLSDFQQYLASTFKVMVPKITCHESSTLVKIYFKEKDQMESLTRLLNNHVWRKKALRAEPWLPLENRKRKREDGEEAQDQKKNKMDEDDVPLTLEEEILAESLPLLNISLEDQTPGRRERVRKEKPWMTEDLKIEINKSYGMFRAWKFHQTEEKRLLCQQQRNLVTKMIKAAKNAYDQDLIWSVNTTYLEEEGPEKQLSRQDAELMSSRLHGLMCAKNPALAGWAEKSCDDFGGTIFEVAEVRTSSNGEGYRNKCKFRIGKNSEGEVIVGFCLNDNENKILGVEPGDKLIHLPDNMKLAAKRMQEFVRQSGIDVYDRKKKTGVWDNLLVRVAPDDRLMLVILVSPTGLDDTNLEKAKEELKEFFINGDGKDCNVLSLYLNVSFEHHGANVNEKLHLLAGQADFEETICGLKFHVSPFSILNINPYSMETIYNGIIELADPAPDSVVLDVCAGSCGIAFSLAQKCEKAYAIEPQEQNIVDAEKTKALNNIQNVEIIKGKCEDKLEKLLEELKDKQLIIILDPPRHGVAIKVISQLRSQPNVQKVIYVCSNTKTGMKNLLELSAPEGKDGQSGVEFSGLPFLPIKVIPIDVAPFTINNTVPVLLERVDPSTYPPATRPPPEPMKRELSKKKGQQSKRQRQRPGSMHRTRGRGGARGVRGSRGPRGSSGRYSAPPLMRPPIRGLMSRSGAPQRRGGSSSGGGSGSGSGSGSRYYDTTSIISKYERRIAELEQQDRAFKAGLTMGLQALNRGGSSFSGSSSSNSRNMGDYSTGEGFGGYRGGYKDPYGENSSPWQNSSGAQFGSRSYNSGGGSMGSYVSGGYDDRQAGGYGSGYGSSGPDRGRQNASQRNNPLSGSRFLGVGGGSSRGGRGRGGSGGMSSGGSRGNRGGGGSRMRR